MTQNKEAPAARRTDRPWIGEAFDAGRQVPGWIAERATTREEFEKLLSMRERAFPATAPGGKYNPRG